MSVSVLDAGAAYAQDAPQGGPAPEGRGHRFHRRHMAGMFGLGQLGLSDQQRQQIRAVMDQHRDELRSAGERLGAARRAQHEAMALVPFDEDQVRARAADVAAAQTEMAVLRGRLHSEVFQLLTPEQQTKAQQLRAERAKRAAERRQRWSLQK
jgi:periplasmic protein CpxP/Spy